MPERRSLNQVLQMSPRQEVAEVNELAVVLVLDIDDSVSVLATSDWFAVDDYVAL